MSNYQAHVISACAELAHEANRIYCAAIGDDSQKSWAETSASTAKIPSIQRADGWRRGPVKDAAAKTHPCLVPYVVHLRGMVLRHQR